MKEFLEKIGKFSLFLLLYFGISFILNQYFIDASSDVEYDQNILVMGDSHIQKAIDPDYLFSAVNFAKTAEPYYLSFWKLKYLLKHGTFDTVILGFAPHNISSFNDYKLVDPTWSIEMFKRYYSIEEFKSLDGVEVDFNTFYQQKFKKLCLYPHQNHTNFIGSYNNFNNSDVSDYKEAIQRHFYYKDKPTGVSQTCISYLDSIITHCRNSDIELILLQTPVHDLYKTRIPKELADAYQDLFDTFILKGLQMPLVDTADYENQDFLNSDHLNKTGAKKFTIQIADKF